MNGKQRILILFLTHVNFLTHTNILLAHITHAKILWIHAILFDQRQNFMNPHHPRYPRYLADSNGEHKCVFKLQLSCCKEHSLNRDSALTMKYCIELYGWRILKKLRTFFFRSQWDSSNEKIELYSFLKCKLRVWDL